VEDDEYRVEVAGVPGSSIRYTPVHPFADDTALLASLEMTADDCQRVDAWCRTDRDACFVQVQTDREVSMIVSWWHDDPPWPYVRASIVAPRIARAEFERVLRTAVVAAIETPVGCHSSWRRRLHTEVASLSAR
jgi:hypothetical protein